MFPTRSWSGQVRPVSSLTEHLYTHLNMMNHKAGRDETHGKNDTNGVEQTLSDLPSEKINERERGDVERLTAVPCPAGSQCSSSVG